MGDAAIWVAIVTALGSLAVSLVDNRRLRAEHRDAREEKHEEGATALRIAEIKAVQEFRDTLRQTVKDQAQTIQQLGEELEENRRERLKFERERLDWYAEKEELQRCVGEVAALRDRMEVLERSLGEAESRENQLAATLESERRSWATQRRGFESRIRSLELALAAAGVDVPHEGGEAMGI